jgi:hypothetical protein
MLRPRLLALPIPRQTRRGDIELRRDAVANLARHVDRIGQERAQETDRRQLHGEPQPIVIAAPTRDKPPIGVVKEETPLQLQPRRQRGEAAVRRRLSVRKKLNRHNRSTYRQRLLHRPRGLSAGSCSIVPHGPDPGEHIRQILPASTLSHRRSDPRGDRRRATFGDGGLRGPDHLLIDSHRNSSSHTIAANRVRDTPVQPSASDAVGRLRVTVTRRIV